MIKDVIIKNKNVIIFTIGSILILLSVILLLYDQILLVKDRVFMEVQMLINGNIDNGSNSDLDSEDDNSNIDINTGYLDENNSSSDITVSDEDIKDSKDTTNNKKYIGYLEIPRISLKQGLVSKKSYYNNVNRNIQIIKVSDFPDVENGNLILASHSGNSSISYFKNLYKLKLGDVANVIYNNKTYVYKIVNIYKEAKDGSINIRRDMTKTTLTLITCTYRDEKTQTVYIAELDKVI